MQMPSGKKKQRRAGHGLQKEVPNRSYHHGRAGKESEAVIEAPDKVNPMTDTFAKEEMEKREIVSKEECRRLQNIASAANTEEPYFRVRDYEPHLKPDQKEIPNRSYYHGRAGKEREAVIEAPDEVNPMTDTFAKEEMEKREIVSKEECRRLQNIASAANTEEPYFRVRDYEPHLKPDQKEIPNRSYHHGRAGKEREAVIEAPDEVNPMTDTFAKEEMEKRERVSKEECRRLQNIASAANTEAPYFRVRNFEPHLKLDQERVPIHRFKHMPAKKERDAVIEDNAYPMTDKFTKKEAEKLGSVSKKKCRRSRNIASAANIKVPHVGVPAVESLKPNQLELPAVVCKSAMASANEYYLGANQPSISTNKTLKSWAKPCRAPKQKLKPVSIGAEKDINMNISEDKMRHRSSGGSSEKAVKRRNAKDQTQSCDIDRILKRIKGILLCNPRGVKHFSIRKIYEEHYGRLTDNDLECSMAEFIVSHPDEFVCLYPRNEGNFRVFSKESGIPENFFLSDSEEEKENEGTDDCPSDDSDAVSEVEFTEYFVPVKYPQDCCDSSCEIPVQEIDWESELLEDKTSGLFVQVQVTEIDSPSKFYFYLVSEKYLLENLLKELEQFYNREEKHYRMPMSVFAEFPLCGAKFDDKYWYRAKVLSIDYKLREVEVFYIDYGTTKKVPTEDCRFLPTVFSYLPAQAIRGQLPVKPIKKDWHPMALQLFYNLVADWPMWAQFVSAENGMNEILLFDTREDEDRIIHEILVTEGFAHLPGSTPTAESTEEDLSSESTEEDLSSESTEDDVDDVCKYLGVCTSLSQNSPQPTSSTSSSLEEGNSSHHSAGSSRPSLNGKHYYETGAGGGCRTC